MSKFKLNTKIQISLIVATFLNIGNDATYKNSMSVLYVLYVYKIHEISVMWFKEQRIISIFY